MKSLKLNIIKKISSKDFDIKNKYEVYRFIKNKIPKGIKKTYEDMNLSVPIRIFRNKNTTSNVIIYIHGGGWVTGSVDSYTNICNKICKETNSIVISIDYRLAPEYKFPAGLLDCYEVIENIYNNPETFNIDNKNITLMGDSAGGNIIAAISIKNSREHKFKIKNQILIYPPLQNDYSLATKYKSVLENGEDYYLTRTMISDYVDLYLNDSKELNNIYFAPLLSKWLFNQPRTLIITADLCPLRDEGYAYYKKLKRFLNKCRYYNIKGGIHGYFSSIIENKKIEETLEIINNFIGEK